jgi:hypothetical protein
MFVSDVSDQVLLPEVLGSPGERYWRTVGLGAQGPWFVITREVRVDGLAVRETSLVMWGGFLAQLISQHDDIVSVQGMVPTAQRDRTWTLTQVNGIWVGSAGAKLPPLFRFSGLQGYRDEFLERVAAPSAGYFKAFPHRRECNKPC